MIIIWSIQRSCHLFHQSITLAAVLGECDVQSRLLSDLFGAILELDDCRDWVSDNFFKKIGILFLKVHVQLDDLVDGCSHPMKDYAVALSQHLLSMPTVDLQWSTSFYV